jgi:hypothetical protein
MPNIIGQHGFNNGAGHNGKPKSNNQLVSVHLAKGDVKKAETWAADGTFTTRSEAIRALVHLGVLVQEGKIRDR